MKFAVISCSASTPSVSRTGALFARHYLQDQGHSAELFDIQSIPLFRVTSEKMNDAPKELAEVYEKVGQSDGVILCYPIYCYTASASAKALTELLGPQLQEKPVATIVGAGSLRSHLATGDLMLSMMYEQSTFCFPKSALLTSDEVEEGTVTGETAERLATLCEDFARFTACLKNYG
jgi:NAD(P)H-dependent FMN reductase